MTTERNTDALPENLGFATLRHADIALWAPHAALAAAGFKPGRFAAHGETVWDGATVPGFVAKRRVDYRVAGYLATIDHAGKGRAAAMAQYAATLTAAGITFAKVSIYGSKKVVLAIVATDEVRAMVEAQVADERGYPQADVAA